MAVLPRKATILFSWIRIYGKKKFSSFFINISSVEHVFRFYLSSAPSNTMLFQLAFLHFIPSVRQLMNKAISFGFGFSFLYSIKPYIYETCGKRRHTCICCYLPVCLYHSRCKCFITLKRLTRLCFEKASLFIFYFIFNQLYENPFNYHFMCWSLKCAPIDTMRPCFQ